jgi:hypothetical protein
MVNLTCKLTTRETLQLYNKLYNTHPAIMHGNGPSKIRLNELSNYLLTSASYKITQVIGNID